MAFNAAYWTALINQSDASKRYYPIASNGGLKVVSEERPDPVFNDFPDGTQEHVRDGVTPFLASITGMWATSIYLMKLKSIGCARTGVYKRDRQGNLIGILSTREIACEACDCVGTMANTGAGCAAVFADTADLIFVPLYADDGTRNGIELSSGVYLYPIGIDNGSFHARLSPATADSKNASIIFGFNFALNAKDQALSMIACSEMEYDISLLRGLLDVCGVFSDITETGLTVKLVTEYGTAINPLTVKNLLLANFAVENITVPQSLALATVTESTTNPGTYVIEWQSNETPGDELVVTVTANGYDFTCVSDTVVVIPTS